MKHLALISFMCVLAAGQAAAGTISCRTAVKAKLWNAAAQSCPAAAKSGDVFAQRALGLMYYQGLGVRQNMVQAQLWLGRAAASVAPAAGSSTGGKYRN